MSQVTDMLKKTGATALVTATTMMAPLVEFTGEREIELTRVISRNLKEVEYESKCRHFVGKIIPNFFISPQPRK